MSYDGCTDDLVCQTYSNILQHSSTVPTRDPAWKVGVQPITRDNVIVVGTVQVSAGGWMPILQIAGSAGGGAYPATPELLRSQDVSLFPYICSVYTS